MKIIEVDLNQFEKDFHDAPTAFDSVEFCRLNASKAEKIIALQLVDDNGTPLCGQIFGLKQGVWCAPFSAPYSMPASNYDSDAFYAYVLDYVKQPLKLAWTPNAYSMINPPSFGEHIVEASYHYPLERFQEYETHLSRSGRYNHHRALKHNFNFFKTTDSQRAYNIIYANRQAMGYPLAMTYAQVLDTIKIINADFFVMTLDDVDIASAMIFHVAPDIVQVIYWGDLPQGRNYRAMNHLAYRIFQWYSENRPDIKIIDIGPASTDGIRNEGLCSFKHSIGCVETEKHIITLTNINKFKSE